jgi:flagellar basal-body rod protein FlgF
MALRRQLEVVANNVANLNTNAFKGESTVFEEHLVRTQSADKTARKLSFVRDIATVRDVTEGRVAQTGSPLDLAISGQGYFAVSTADGERYTRNGHFEIGPDGKVVNGQGHELLSSDGSTFSLEPTEGQISVARDGSFSTNLGLKGKVKLVTFADEQEMKKVGESLYGTDQKPEAATKSGILQGSIEQSNVQPVLEVTKMMDLVQTYEQVTQAMNQADDLNKEAVKELGQVPNS